MTAAAGKILGLDSATDDVVVGLLGPDGLAYAGQVPPGEAKRPRHATLLLAEIERAAEAGGGWEGVVRIGIGIGPGSYTGVRIGIATGRALAQARRIETVAVGTLTALARGIAERANDPDRPCLAAIDARRGELFVQLCDGTGEPLCVPAVVSPEVMAEWIAEAGGSAVAGAPAAPLAGGSGAVRFRRELEAARVETLPAGDPAHRLAARHVCELASTGTVRPIAGIRPIYLREPDARRWLERDSRDRDQKAGL